MDRRMLALWLALGAFALAGCARAAAPTVAATLPPAIQEKPIANPSADVRALIKQLTTPDEFTVINGRKVRTFSAMAVPDVATVRGDYPSALFPTYTAGRKLAGIVLKRANFPQSFPSTTLWLLYQDNLQISETDNRGAPPHSSFGRGMPVPGSETTTVAGVNAEAFIGRGLPKHPDLAVVRWEVGGQSYLVSAPHITVAQAVRIARSMTP